MEAELAKIGLELRSIAGAMPGWAIVVNPPAHHQLAAFQNPIAPVSNSIFALAALALCAIAIRMALSARGPRKPRGRHNRVRVAGAYKASRPVRISARGSHPVLRLAPGRRGKT